jgi:hypothetical protein
LEQLALSSSAFRDASNCLKRFEYRWVDELVPLVRNQGEALRRGLWIHRCLEMRDWGQDHSEELARMVTWALDNGAEALKTSELAHEVDYLVESYQRYWIDHPDPMGPWELAGTEVPVTFEPAPGVKLSATVDCLKKDNHGRLWIWERKTLGEIPDSDWRGVDPQTMLQLVLLRTGEPVVGVVFDYVWTKSPPVLRVKKDGMLYAGDDEKQTTMRRLAEALPQIRANWKHHLDFEGPDAYVQWLYGRVIADGLWFQRFPTLRSDAHLLDNMQDVADTVRAVVEARKRGHYRRAWNSFTCPRFCPYMKLCANEFQLGKRNEVIRETMFTKATQDMWDQGRSA